MNIEKARGILAVFKEPLIQQEQAYTAWQFCTEYGDKLLAFVDAWDECQIVTSNQMEKLCILMAARKALDEETE